MQSRPEPTAAVLPAGARPNAPSAGRPRPGDCALSGAGGRPAIPSSAVPLSRTFMTRTALNAPGDPAKLSSKDVSADRFAATVTGSSWLAGLRKGGRGRIRHVYTVNGFPQTLMGPPIFFP